MSLKGISWFEQHVEKIFAGVMGVALLGALTWQFVGPQNTVKVGRKPDVPMPQAYDEVATAARDVNIKIDDPNLPEEIAGRDEVKGMERLTGFMEAYNGKVAPDQELAGGWLGSAPAGFSGKGPGGGDGNRTAVATLSVPTPATPTAASQLISVHPVELYGPQVTPETRQAVAAVMPPGLPYDKAGVSLETQIDGKSFRAQLEADPDGSGPGRAIPGHWWRDRVEIIDVVTERQTMAADGTWGEVEVLAPMPGRMSLRPLMKENPTARELLDLVTRARQSLAVLRRPAYYKSLIGREWMTPSQVIASKAQPVADASEVKRLQDRRAEIQKQIQNFDTLIQQAGGGGGGTGGEGAGERRENRENNNERATPNARLRNLQSQRERFQRELQEVEEQLRAMGVRLEGEQAAPTEQPAAAETDRPLLDAEAVRLWSHDVTVERGRTYRYRVSVRINNPVFGFANNLPEEQAALAATPYLTSEASAWSSPVRVDEETYFFVMSASEDAVAGGLVGGARISPSASVELYQFRWGAWRKAAGRFEPGDMLVATTRIPDLLAKAQAIEVALQGGTPPVQPGGGGGGERDGRGNTPPAPGGEGAAAAAPVDPNGKLVEDPAQLTDLRIIRRAVLLDVSPVALSVDARTPPNEAVLRDQDGRVVVRLPDDEKKSPSYLEVSRPVPGAKPAVE